MRGAIVSVLNICAWMKHESEEKSFVKALAGTRL